MDEINKYFPCLLVEHEDENYSIITSEFHCFDDYFGKKEAGGYGIERLAKKLVKENKIKGIKYDSEAGMFCAISNNKENLLQLCNLLKEITGEEDLYISDESTKPLIPLEEAEILLQKGFVKSLDKKAQKIFLENVPMPSLSKKQSKYLYDIQFGSDDEKIYASRRVNSESRTRYRVRDWENYLSHPNTVSIFLEAIDKKQNSKVHQELIWAMVFICDRHMPDLRVQPYFVEALQSKIGTVRWLGVMGLPTLANFSFEYFLPLINDRSYKVREKILSLLKRDEIRKGAIMHLPALFSLFKDDNRSVRISAMGLIEKIETDNLIPEFKQLVPIYKDYLKVEEAPHIKKMYERTIDKIAKMKRITDK